MRSNGLTARAYRPVADVDPRLADALLDELKDRGIAAYATPIATTTTAGLEPVTAFSTGQERLYVDARQAGEVEELIRHHDTDLLSADNDDLSWAQIVADFDQPVSSERRSWPADEDVSAGDATPDELVAVDDIERRQRRDPNRERDRDRDDDHFVPEPPPPLPSLDPVSQLAWVGVLGGPLLFLVAALFGVALPSFFSLLGVVGFVGGFVTLVSRMPNDDGDSEPGNGAVV